MSNQLRGRPAALLSHWFQHRYGQLKKTKKLSKFTRLHWLHSGGENLFSVKSMLINNSLLENMLMNFETPTVNHGHGRRKLFTLYYDTTKPIFRQNVVLEKIWNVPEQAEQVKFFETFRIQRQTTYLPLIILTSFAPSPMANVVALTLRFTKSTTNALKNIYIKFK